MITRTIFASIFWVCFGLLSLMVLRQSADQLLSLLTDRLFVFISVAMFTFAILYTLLSYRTITETRKQPVVPRESPFLDFDEIDRFRDAKGKGVLQWASASAYLDGVMYPKYLFERITESAVPWHRSVRMSSTYTVSIGTLPATDEPVDLVVPLFLFPRGQLQDGLRVMEGGERRVSTLSQRRVVAFSAAVARDQIRGCGKRAYRQYLEEVEPTVLALWTAEEPATDAELEEVRRMVLALPSKPNKRSTLETAAGYLIELARYHPVCVTIGDEQ